MPKVHIYNTDITVKYPGCKVDKRVANTDPNRNTESSKATCVACLRNRAFMYKEEDALDRYLQLKF